MLDKSQLSAPIGDDNVDAQEIARFDALADAWWDPAGKYRTALSFNAARVEFIVGAIQKHFKPSGIAVYWLVYQFLMSAVGEASSASLWPNEAHR